MDLRITYLKKFFKKEIYNRFIYKNNYNHGFQTKCNK